MQPLGSRNPRAAIIALYEAHFERVVRCLVIRIGDWSEAERLGIQVFVRVIQRAFERSQSDVPLEVLLYRVAHDVAVDHWRRRNRRPVIGPPANPTESPVNWRARLDAAALIKRSEDALRLAQAISRLSSRQQQALALRLGARFKVEQMAQILGESPEAAIRLLAASLRRLHTILSGDNWQGYDASV